VTKKLIRIDFFCRELSDVNLQFSDVDEKKDYPDG